MPDQATELRRLISGESDRAASRDSGPRTLVISGGKPGVGATSLAVHLAELLAQDALRVVLIDADLYRADVAARCNLTAAFGIGDVLAGRRSIHEVLLRGRAGLQVVAGTAASDVRGKLSDRAIQRLLKQMQTLRPHADWLLVDAGNQPSEFTARLWSVADTVLLVTSPDAVAVMDTYALVKTLLSRHSLRRPLELIVNQVSDEIAAADVHRRIDQSCRRFLGLSVELAGWLPQAPAAHGRPSDGPLAESFVRVARRVLASQPGSSQRRMAA
jgi:flagellar biosynthesis protein FlhG